MSDTVVAATFTFADIDFWVGAGTNRAALVIDWQENNANPPTLVWGYRWNGTANGAKMLADIVAADPRLFAKFGGTSASPTAVYGLGYDANNNHQFALNDGTQFNPAGIAITEPADVAVCIDSDDFYAEGWYTGFWHYGVASSNPFDGGAWSDTPIGMGSRQLVDGAWDSWTFSPTFNFASNATNPQPAASPYPAGDYDRNMIVDANDFFKWKSLYGSTADPSADGNRDGIVNAADYTVWRNQFGSGTALSKGSGATVPEPQLVTLIFVVLIAVWNFRIRERLICANRR